MQSLSFAEIHYAKYVQPNSKLTNIFLDPLGNHLLMSFVPMSNTKDKSPELLYLHSKSIKPKSVSKSRNFEVTGVGWNYENKSSITTGPILLGTSHGHLFETELVADSDSMFTANQQYWRPVSIVFHIIVSFYLLLPIDQLMEGISIADITHCDAIYMLRRPVCETCQSVLDKHGGYIVQTSYRNI